MTKFKDRNNDYKKIIFQLRRWIQELAVADLKSFDNPNRAGFLNSLGNHLSARYEREGNLEDLEQAIKYCQEAVDMTPLSKPDRADFLNSLGNHLSIQSRRGQYININRYHHRFGDIHTSIYERETLVETPAGEELDTRDNVSPAPLECKVKKSDQYPREPLDELPREKAQEFNEGKGSIAEGQQKVDPAPSETFEHVDSAYGIASHGHDDGKSAMTPEVINRNDSTKEDKADARSVYSTLSTSASVIQNYLEDFVEDLFSASSIPIANTERFQRLCKTLEQLLQEFAIRIGDELLSQDGQEILYHVYRNRRLAPRFMKLDKK